MAHPLKQAESSAKKFGGNLRTTCQSTTGLMSPKPSCQTSGSPLFDIVPKASSWCERIFAVAITNSEGKQVPVCYIGEQHVRKIWDGFPGTGRPLARQACTWMYGQCFCLLKDRLISFNNRIPY